MPKIEIELERLDIGQLRQLRDDLVSWAGWIGQLPIGSEAGMPEDIDDLLVAAKQISLELVARGGNV